MPSGLPGASGAASAMSKRRPPASRAARLAISPAASSAAGDAARVAAPGLSRSRLLNS
jgi:hypothetical protein